MNRSSQTIVTVFGPGNNLVDICKRNDRQDSAELSLIDDLVAMRHVAQACRLDKPDFATERVAACNPGAARDTQRPVTRLDDDIIVILNNAVGQLKRGGMGQTPNAALFRSAIAPEHGP